MKGLLRIVYFKLRVAPVIVLSCQLLLSGDRDKIKLAAIQYCGADRTVVCVVLFCRAQHHSKSMQKTTNCWLLEASVLLDRAHLPLQF